MSFWGYSREEEAYLGDKGRPVPQGEEGKTEIAKVVQAQGNGPRRQGKAGRQSGDTGREINRLHLINSQAIHAGHDFSSSNQAETMTL